MKRITLCTLIFFYLCSAAIAQVEVDKSIQLTGSGSDARVTGIDEVSDPKDAVSAEVEQRNQLTYADATNLGSALSVTLTPAPDSYTTGMVVHFKSSLESTGSLTLNVNGLGDIPVKKNFNVDIAAGDIKSGQMVSVMFDGTNFQMLSPIAAAPAAGLTAENSSNTSTWTSATSSNSWEDITTHTHTVTQNGRYLIAASFESVDGGGGTHAMVRINAAGKTSSSVKVGAWLGSFQPFHLTFMADLTAGQTVKLQNQNDWNNSGYKNQVKNIVFSLIKVM